MYHIQCSLRNGILIVMATVHEIIFPNYQKYFKHDIYGILIVYHIFLTVTTWYTCSIDVWQENWRPRNDRCAVIGNGVNRRKNWSKNGIRNTRTHFDAVLLLFYTNQYLQVACGCLWSQAGHVCVWKSHL